MRDKVAAALGASVFIGASVFMIAGANGAYGAAAASCTIVGHHDLNGVRIDNDSTTTNATTTLLDRGVEITTPDDTAKMSVRFPTVFALSDVTTMTYETYRYSSSTDPAGDADAVPAYEIDVLLSGHANTATDPLPAGWTGPWSTTLIYAPSKAEGSTSVSDDTWQTWDADQGGAATWWSTTPLSAIASDQGPSTPETWSSILAAYPNAVGTAYGVDQGAGSAGAVTAVDAVTFGTSAGCTTQAWTADTPPAAAVPSASAAAPAAAIAGTGPIAAAPTTPTTEVAPRPGSGYAAPGRRGTAPVPASSPTATAAATAPANAAAADTGTTIAGLALTGPDFIVPAGFGLLLIISGSILFRVARRRRQMMF